MPDSSWNEEIKEKVVSTIRRYRPRFDLSQQNIVEIGCGPGRVLLPMAADSNTAVGLDASRLNLRRVRQSAKNRGVTVDTHYATTEVPPLTPKPTTIYSIAVFQHLRRRNTLSYTNSAYNRLQDGGIAAFFFRDLTTPRNQKKLMSNLNQSYKFRMRYHTTEEVSTYMRMVGFDDCEVYQISSRNGRGNIAAVGEK
jgi:cyclopropane fatty-acyl-phospholipid synthase-like methyltransferase